MKYRKGITPVIATVLLLGITVAIGGLLYTQVQNTLSSGSGVSGLEKVQNTEMRITPYLNDTNGNTVGIQVTNTGSVTWNRGNFTVLYSSPGGPLQPAGTNPDWNNCFDATVTVSPDIDTLDPGQSFTCDTGVTYPSSNPDSNTVTIEVSPTNADKSWSSECVRSSPSDKSC